MTEPFRPDQPRDGARARRVYEQPTNSERIECMGHGDGGGGTVLGGELRVAGRRGEVGGQG